MITIDGFKFPDSPEDKWEPYIIYTALNSTTLLVAKTRIEGEWSCYCVTVPGKSHETEKHMWQIHGTKIRERIARAAFPDFENIPYNH